MCMMMWINLNFAVRKHHNEKISTEHQLVYPLTAKSPISSKGLKATAVVGASGVDACSKYVAVMHYLLTLINICVKNH